MQALTRKEFNKRWNKAQQKNTAPVQALVKPAAVSITLDGILDGYEQRVKRAQAAKALSNDECNAICEAISALKTASSPVSHKLQPFLETSKS